jgi:hypothetical protein
LREGERRREKEREGERRREKEREGERRREKGEWRYRLIRLSSSIIYVRKRPPKKASTPRILPLQRTPPRGSAISTKHLHLFKQS